MTAVYLTSARVQPLPDTAENHPLYERFECSICRLEDPRIKGGTVFHEAIANSLGQISDGKSHPAHRDCVMINFSYKETCANCRAPLDPSPIMSFPEKAAASLRRLPARMIRQAAAAYRAYCQSKPWQKHVLGAMFLSYGILGGKIILIPVGSLICSRAFGEQESYWKETARKAREMASTARKWLSFQLEKKQTAQSFAEQTEALTPEMASLVAELKASGDPFAAVPIFSTGQNLLESQRQRYVQIADESEPNLGLAAEKVSAISWSAWEAYASSWGYWTGKWFMNATTTVFGIHLLKTAVS